MAARIIFRYFKVWRLRLIRSEIAGTLASWFDYLWPLTTATVRPSEIESSARARTRAPDQSRAENTFCPAVAGGQRPELLAGYDARSSPIARSVRIATHRGRVARICVIGDSHISALVLGWRQIESKYPAVSLAFYGAPGELMRDLAVGPTSLTAARTALGKFLAMGDPRREIPGNSDHYIVCGLGMRLLHVRPLAKFRTEEMSGRVRIPISDACFVRCLQGRFRQTAAVETIGKLRKLTTAPIALMPQPHPSAEGSWSWLDRIERHREDAIIANLFDRACNELARELAIQLVLQPEFTKSRPLRTEPAYSMGSMMLNGKMSMAHPRGEASHMNADYGAAVLHALLEGIRIEAGTDSSRVECGADASPSDTRL